MCAVVSALSLELPQLGGDDAGEGSDGGPYDCVDAVGEFVNIFTCRVAVAGARYPPY